MVNEKEKCAFSNFNFFKFFILGGRPGGTYIPPGGGSGGGGGGGGDADATIISYENQPNAGDGSYKYR